MVTNQIYTPMKKIVISILIALIVVSTGISAQNSYFKIFYYPETQDCSNAVKTQDNSMILAIQTSLNQNMLLKINLVGDTVASRNITSPRYYCYLTRILETQNHEYIGIGYGFDLGVDVPYSNVELTYVHFNENLEILGQNTFFVSDSSWGGFTYPNAILNNEQHTIIGIQEELAGSITKIDFYEISSTDDSIATYTLMHNRNVVFKSMVQKTDLSGYYISVKGAWESGSNNNCSIIEVDNEFNLVTSDTLPGEIGYNNQLRYFNDHSFISGGRADIWHIPPVCPPWPWETLEYCIEKLDTNFAPIKQAYLCPLDNIHDTAYNAAHLQNFDFIDTNNIYTCYYYDISGSPYYGLNFMSIAKLNANLEVKWQYFYGFDAYYDPYAITATTDGGCFLHGLIYYNPNKNPNNCDLFYVQVDSSGLFLLPNKKLSPIVHSAILYPNPGKDLVYIQSGPQVNGALMQLFDISGKPIAEQRIDATLLQLPVQNLPKGVYPWRIVLNNKVVDSGKWVKE